MDAALLLLAPWLAVLPTPQDPDPYPHLPHLEELERFPSREVALQQWRRCDAWADYLERWPTVNGDALERRERVKWLRWASTAWDALVDATWESAGDEHKREALQRLSRILGDGCFASGMMPERLAADVPEH